MKECIICHSKNVKWLVEEKKCIICMDCDAVFKNTFPNYKDRFSDELIGKKTIKELIVSIISKRFWKVVSDQYMKYILTNNTDKIKNALDIGAAYGYFVKAMNEHDINAEGIEASIFFINSLVTSKIKHGYFDENYQDDKKYDLICFTQMIYYLHNPILVLEHAKKFLNDDGMIFIVTHNPSSSTIRNYLIGDLIESGMTVILSKKNFETLESRSKLKLIDYSTYEPHMYLDRINAGGNPFYELKNYIKYYFKKAYSSNTDGHIAFILLKPTI